MAVVWEKMRKLWTCIYTHLSPRGHDFIGSFLLSLSCSLAAPPQALPHIELGLLGKIKSGMEQQFSIYPTSAVSRHVVVQWIWIRIWPNSLSNFLLLFFPTSKASTTIKAVAQKPETFQVATFYGQKLSGRSARKRSFASHDIVKECAMNVHAPPPPSSHPLNRKSANFTQQGISKRAHLS